MSYKNTNVSLVSCESPPENLPVILDDMSLAFQIGIYNKTMWSVIIKTHDDPLKTNLYKKYEIPKPSGKKRVVYDPSSSWPPSIPVKKILKATKNLFFSNFTWPEFVDGYVPGKSTIDSAAKHVGAKTIICCDIKNFFPSITHRFVQDAFKDLFHYNHDVSGLIARLVTLEKRVPQGGRISPDVAKSVALDRLGGSLNK